VVYHGADRELEEMERPGRVLITSYGILLRDVEALGRFRFGIAAFDEAQHIKNPQTRSYRAAQAVSARMKLAVTGTPIENRLSELKALMDLCLPGYLGGDAEFAERYGASDGRGISAYRRAELNRLITPFTLRRRKASVLTELPEKIEDIRYCRLTEAQVRLYRQAVADRGRGLQQALENSDAEIPYIHIFALLTLLKQICDHPAIIDPERSGAGGMPLDSGKWEVFTELLADCLETGQKVVVYSQFVAMVRMIEKHIAESGVGAVSLTGATRKRGEVIDRFNHDPECRVFVGSLKAGGTGIDLTGGSVVIHYDRWWNAAKEDQATDRVHRIGQKRGVQVFKLVTEGTLEEKIAAVISRKKDLMAEVIQEDDPGVLKTFSRRELAELLADPGPGAAPG
jgi:SNF2 family DNA or RNA helicase